ncbi:hypothetical protein [Burkholderia thailandensis]|uniref:hypothetical protein n=1 Tax=Burkholderia thailandensis TaxID=57975 RepID=UPI0012DA903A|nr:hypothetical protein [Burkholderia thailandensis]
MYTGWMRPFNFDGVVGCDTDSVELSRRRQGDCSPRQRLGLISINSTYIDWIDRRFLYRGMFATAFVLLGFVVFVSAFLFLVGYSLFFYQDFWDSVGAGVCALIVISFAVVFCYKSLKFEFFLHIYYPIRFNRKNVRYTYSAISGMVGF